MILVFQNQKHNEWFRKSISSIGYCTKHLLKSQAVKKLYKCFYCLFWYSLRLFLEIQFQQESLIYFILTMTSWYVLLIQKEGCSFFQKTTFLQFLFDYNQTSLSFFLKRNFISKSLSYETNRYISSSTLFKSCRNIQLNNLCLPVFSDSSLFFVQS